MPASADRSVPFDASRPHVARVYDYLLGGKDNFAADRAVGDRMLASIPAVQLGRPQALSPGEPARPL